MSGRASETGGPIEAIDQPKLRGRLFRKYVAFFAAVVCIALVSYSAFELLVLLSGVQEPAGAPATGAG